MFTGSLPPALFWQNDRSLLRATAVTRGWNGHRIESQDTKLTLEKKILPPLLSGFELATFRSLVRRSNQPFIQAPRTQPDEPTDRCVVHVPMCSPRTDV